MRICLCDDEPTALSYIQSLILKWQDSHSCTCEVTTFRSGEEMLLECGDTFPFDLILLDVQMYTLNGLNLARKIRETDAHVSIAFLTAVRDYVFEGYEVQAIRYLLKPLREEQLFQLLDQTATHLEQSPQYLILDVNGEKKKIHINDLFWVEAQGHYLVFHTRQETFQKKGTFSALQKELEGSCFCLTHRSFLANIQHIVRITKTDCIFSNGERIPISRNTYRSLNDAFISYYREAVL